MTEVKAEVPMSEMLAYAPDLRSITGGQGEFTMEFERYEEIPAHLAQKVRASRRPEDAGSRVSQLAKPQPGSLWPARATSARTSRTSPATSAGARCCAASGPSPSWPAARAGRSASCARRAPSTRAGSASPAPTS